MSMDCSYAGVSFGASSRDGFLPDWEEELAVSVEHYPDTDTDEVQIGGKSKQPLSISVWLDSEANKDTLKAAVGSTARTLVYRGTTYTSRQLTGVRNIQIHPDGVSAELTFLDAS